MRDSRIAHAGLYQLGEWETRRHESKNVLRRELAQGLGVVVPAGKRIVFYCGGLLDCPEEQIRTVLRLSRRYFVIFKPFYFLSAHEALLRAPSTVVIRDTLTIAPGCMRFAADVILASPISGVFTTCLMLGLAVLPLLTEHQALPQARETFAPCNRSWPRTTKNCAWRRFWAGSSVPTGSPRWRTAWRTTCSGASTGNACPWCNGNSSAGMKRKARPAMLRACCSEWRCAEASARKRFCNAPGPRRPRSKAACEAGCFFRAEAAFLAVQHTFRHAPSFRQLSLIMAKYAALARQASAARTRRSRRHRVGR